MTDHTIDTTLLGVYLKKGFLLFTGGFPCRKHISTSPRGHYW